MLRTLVRILRSTVRVLWQRNRAAIQFERLAQTGALSAAQVDGYVNIQDSATVQATRQWLCASVMAHLPQHGAVLDAGCGSGYYLEQIARGRPDLALYGVDISAATLANYTRHLLPSAQLAVGDFSREAPFPGQSFDLVYCITVLQYVHPIYLRGAIRNLAAGLKPGAPLLIAMPTGLDWRDRWNMQDYYRHTAQDLREGLRTAGLTITEQSYAPESLVAGSRRDYVVMARRQ